MADYESNSAEQIEIELCRRLAKVRLNQNVTQTKLATESGVSPRTIRRMEKGEGISLETLIRVMMALDLTSHLHALVPSQEIQPIQRVRGGADRVRERASGKRKRSSKSQPWKWGDE